MPSSQGAVFDQRELLCRLRLSRAERVGPITFKTLLHRWGTAERVLDELNANPAFITRIPSQGETKRELDRLEALGGSMIHLGQPEYPTALAAIADPPPVLSCLGDRSVLERPMVGIVGTRNATAAALGMARRIASDLSEHGYVVVSGFARGIDSACHKGSLSAGTVAVLANGIDVVYPPENADLQARMVKPPLKGLLVSEVSLGSRPIGAAFPRRNRIIAGLSLGVLVVEAKTNSGSMITARLANDYGREVMAVPGLPLDGRFSGCLDLIRNGATLVESADDVIAALDPQAGTLHQPSKDYDPGPKRRHTRSWNEELESLRDLSQQVRNSLSGEPVTIEMLLEALDADVASVMVALAQLELEGVVDVLAGGSVVLRNPEAPSASGAHEDGQKT